MADRPINGVCAKCGSIVPLLDLDGKPSSTRFKAEAVSLGQAEALCLAADRGENFDVIECRDCYGPGYCSAVLEPGP